MGKRERKKKKLWQKCLAFLNVYYLKTHLIKALNSLDSSRPNGRLSQNPKTGSFRELFLPENDFNDLNFFPLAILHMNAV